MPSQGRTAHAPSVIDTLTEILHLLQEAKLLPDAKANMQFIQVIEQGILQYIEVKRQKDIQQAVQGQQQQQGGQPGGMPSMGGGQPGGMGGGMPGGMPGGGMGGPPGMGGGMPPRQIAPGGGAGMSGFGSPNPDELRRVLAGPAAVGNGGS